MLILDIPYSPDEKSFKQVCFFYIHFWPDSNKVLDNQLVYPNFSYFQLQSN